MLFRGAAQDLHWSPLLDQQRLGRMLLVTIELVPGGFGPLTRKIASMRISNVSELADASDYCVESAESANPLTREAPRTTECLVRALPAWALLKRACEEVMKVESLGL